MRKAILTGALLALMAVAAEAQVRVEYDKRSRNSSLRVTWDGGYYSGYGFGYGSGFGYSSGFAPGFVGSFGGGTLAFGTRHYLPYGPGWSRYGTGFAWRWPQGSYSYYSGPVYPYYYAPYTVMDYAPPRAIVAGGPAPNPALAVAREIEEGRGKFKAGDYRGAVDAFRAAVVADISSASSQAWFALGLAAAGDFRNADKALRAAAGGAPFGEIDLKDLFKDGRERDRVLGVLGRVSGDGALAAAWVRMLAGDPAPLRKLAEKDGDAKKLLPRTGGSEP